MYRSCCAAGVELFDTERAAVLDAQIPPITVHRAQLHLDGTHGVVQLPAKNGFLSGVRITLRGQPPAPVII